MEEMGKFKLVTLGCLLAAGLYGQTQNQAQEPPPPPPNNANEAAGMFGTAVVIPGGIKGQVYALPFGQDVLPDFSTAKLIGTIYTKSINIPTRDFSEGFPGVSARYEWFAIEYTGNFFVRDAGIYGFLLTSDDGSRLWIDDQLVGDDDGQHQPTTVVSQVQLATGVHRLRLQYFQGPKYQVALTLVVRRPGDPKPVIFNVENFVPQGADEQQLASAQLTPNSAEGDGAPRVPSLALAEFKHDQGAFDSPSQSQYAFAGTVYEVKAGAGLYQLARLKPTPIATVHTDSLDMVAAPWHKGSYPGLPKGESMFAVDYSGSFVTKAPGMYWFALNSNQQVVMFIDGQLVLDREQEVIRRMEMSRQADWQGSTPHLDYPVRYASVRLGPGQHRIELIYCKSGDWSPTLQLFVAEPGGSAFKLFKASEVLGSTTTAK